MKRIIHFLFIALIVSSCGSSKKMLEKGNYDAAINAAVKKLRKDRDNEKNIEALDRAYQIANQQDQERVTFLEREDNPNNYEEVFAIYTRMKNRQSLVRTVTPLNLNGRTIDYPYVDYDAKIIAAKRKAAEYFYGSGKSLMSSSIN